MAESTMEKPSGFELLNLIPVNWQSSTLATSHKLNDGIAWKAFVRTHPMHVSIEHKL